MDLKYEKYIHKEYFLDGFDATEDNPYGKKFIENMPDVYFLKAIHPSNRREYKDELPKGT